MNKRMRELLLIGIPLACLGAGLEPANAAPVFQVPLPCGMEVDMQTGPTHDRARGKLLDMRRAPYSNDSIQPGTPIMAAAGGTVTSSTGDQIRINHGDGYFTMYLHLQARYVGVNQFVRAGQQIGEMGNAGNSGGSVHLHYEVFRDVNGNSVGEVSELIYPVLNGVEYHLSEGSNPWSVRVTSRNCRTDDIIWQHASGQVHYWPIVGGVRQGGANVHIPAGPEWRLRGTGDINGDGSDDIIWQHVNGQVHYWPMRNGVRLGGYDVHTPVSSDWTLRDIGDVDGNGTDDIIWQGSTGQVHYWPMWNGVRQGGYNISTPVSSDWTLRGVGDVDGDDTDDIIWQGSTGQVHYWRMLAGFRLDGYHIHWPQGSEWTIRGIGNIE